MFVFTPSFECRRRAMWLALSLGLMLPACAHPPQTSRMNTTPAHAAISNITLERDCSGCSTGMRLELRDDGVAVATTTGKPRLGTADRVTRAPLPAAEFETLARQLMASGFFEMAAVYEEPGLQDGRWATLTVVRAGTAHQVFRREDAGPAALKAVEAAMSALQARLRFVPDAR